MSQQEDQRTVPPVPPRVLWAGRIAGPLLALVVYAALSGSGINIEPAARTTAALTSWIALWWMTQALPLPATSLLPLVLLPLTGVLTIKEAAAPYANPIIFLFLGGFLIALAIERWHLHRRLALMTVLAVGTSPRRLVGGFMIGTAMLSMWISNTATTVMMLPVGLSVIRLVAGKREAEDEEVAATSAFAVCLLLGLAYAANIGGVGTLVGTPPNIVLAGFVLETFDIQIGFARWMLLGVPLVVIFLLITWLLLTCVLFPLGQGATTSGRRVIRQQLAELGPMSRGEWIVATVFLGTALAWIFREPLAHWSWLTERVPAMGRLDDTIIAMIGALVLFFIPVHARQGVFAMDWQTTRRLPWGILLLFGGGLSLASAIQSSGLAAWIGSQVHQLGWLPPAAIVVVTTAMVIFLTEVTSNTATATTFLPILGGVAAGLNTHPLLLLVPATLAASFAFMMPVGTPPNAIVFGSGQITIGQMMRAGLCLNLIGSIVIPLLMYALGAWVLGVPLTRIPH